MKDIRLCDDGDITTTIDLCEENNLGIQIQGFYNPYIDNKNELKLKYLEELKRIICIENQFESDSELLLKLIDEVNDNKVKICLDIGYAHANSNVPVEEWIKALKDRIVYYHLHNNHGKQTVLGYNKDDEHFQD